MINSTKLQLRNEKFEQITGQTLTLSGITQIGVNGTLNISAKTGINISGTSFLRAGSNDITSIELGQTARAFGSCSVAIGHESYSCTGGVAVGCRAYSIGSNSSAFGRGSCTVGNQSIAFGFCSEARGIDSVAIGRSSIVSGNSAIAIGNSSSASDNSSIAIGCNSCAILANAIAIGCGSGSYNNCTMNLGFNVTGNTANSFGIGWHSVSASPEVFFAKSATQYINGSGDLIIGSGGTVPVSQSKIHLEGDLYFSNLTSVPSTPASGGILFNSGTTLLYLDSTGSISNIKGTLIEKFQFALDSDLFTTSAKQTLKGPYNFDSFDIDSKLSNATFETKLNSTPSSGYTSQANITALNSWIDSNVSTNTLWDIRVIGVYDSSETGEAITLLIGIVE